jgi:hypothetical protein
MGWAVKREDGTYRGWARNSQTDIPLLPGEVYEEMADPPPVVALTLDENYDALRWVKAVALALGTHPTMGLTAAQIKTRVLAAYNQLP